MPEQEEPTRLMLPYLRAWRMQRVLSQRELANRAGVTPGTVIRLERGEKANYLTIHKLAKGLGVSVQQLLRDNPEVQQLLQDNPEAQDIRGVA